MKQLLSFEYRKLIRSKALYICAIVMVCLNIIGVVITKASMDFINSSFSGMSDTDLQMFGAMDYSGLKYLLSACNGSNMLIFFAIFVTIFVCSDFTEGTIKNIVSRGYSREKIFFAKSIVIGTGSVLFSMLSMLTGFVAGSIAFGVGKDFGGTTVLTILIQLLAMIAYTMMNVLLAVLFGKLGGALTLGIIIPLIYPIIIQLLDLLVVFMSDKSSEVTQDFFSRFTVGTNMTKISVIGADGKDLLFAAVIFFVYIMLFTLLGVLAIRKKEV